MTILTVLQRLRPKAAVPVAFVGVALVAVADYTTGGDLSLLLFYAAAVTVIAWHGTRPMAAAAVVLACAGTFVAQVYGAQAHGPVLAGWNSAARLVFLLGGAWLVAELRTTLEREERHARVDRLTYALNRFGFEERLETELSRARRTGGPVAAAYLDVDDLKDVNDRGGHEAGDQVLRRLATAVQSAVRETDVFARVGGDEFALLLPETGQPEARKVLDRILGLLETRVESGEGVAVSAGLAIWENLPPQTADEVFAACDALMYEAKRAGGRRVVDLVVG